MTSKLWCSVSVWHRAESGRVGYSSQCAYPIAVERDGAPYCRFHDPMRVASRHKALEDAWDMRRAERAVAITLREKHERIGWMVVQNVKALRVLAGIVESAEALQDPVGILAFTDEVSSIKTVLAALLKEVES